MYRLLNDGARNLNVDQPDQPIENPPLAPNQGRPPAPVMRQRQTAREDDEDEIARYQSNDLSIISPHTKPPMISRTNANQDSLQLDPIDQEKFVYTRKHFDDALEKNDAKTMVKMLRYGVIQQSDTWCISDGEIIAKKLVDTNKPELLAELIREKELFQESFISNSVKEVCYEW